MRSKSTSLRAWNKRGLLDKLDAALTPELASIANKAKTVLSDAFATLGRRIKTVRISLPGTGSLGADLGDGVAGLDEGGL